MSSCDYLSSFGLSELKAPDLRPPATLSSSSSPSLTLLSSSPSPSSLYLAVKVRTLINTFRKRVKSRPQTSRKKFGDSSFCRDLEREAYSEIDRYLGRTQRRARNRKSREGATRAFTTSNTFTTDAPCGTTDIKRSIHILNNVTGFDEPSLTKLAGDNKLFLSRKGEFALTHLNTKALSQLVVAVKDLLEAISRTTHPCLAASALSSTKDAELSTLDLTDPASLANFLHLLLCLQSQLIQQLVRCCIDVVRDHIIEWQKTRERSCEDWFFEFPDARHPLSTTWPWAIKPSLAVLWGVCWMFIDPIYWDKEDNVVDQEGKILVSRRQLEQLHVDLAAVEQEHQNLLRPLEIRRSINSNSSVAPMLAGSTSGGVLYSPQQTIRLAPRGARPSAYAMAASAASTQPQQHTSSPSCGGSGGIENTSSRVQHSTYPSARNQAAASPFGLAQLDTNTPAYRAAQPAAHSVAEGSWLPQDTNFQPGPASTYNPHLEQHADWQWQPPNYTLAPTTRYPVPPQTHRGGLVVDTRGLPPRPRSTSQVVTPTITVTGDQHPYNTPDSQPQPQDSQHTSAKSTHAPYSFGDAFSYNTLHSEFSNLHHSRRDPMADVQIPPQVGNNNGIASPISDHPPLSRPISPSQHMQMPESVPAPAPAPAAPMRKRSYSTMSQDPPQQMQMPPAEHHSPYPDPTEASPSGMDETPGHKVQRMIKRGDPPQAHDGKYYCNFAPECAGQYFDRKCEWSKHMDKHDRPYRCPQPQCAKLQGFTYSGGLLRHEREVHGKHGGPKEQLRCTVAECKRHTGKGFTRKENLNEHLRRVHGITADPTQQSQPTQPSQQSQQSQLRQIAADAAPGAEMMETPASRFSDNAEMDEMNAATPAYPDLAKRRRIDTEASPRSGVDDLDHELQRLRADNLEKDERIRRMEEAEAAREERLESLEKALAQLTSQTLNRMPEHTNMDNSMSNNMGHNMSNNIGGNMGTNMNSNMGDNIDANLSGSMGGHIGTYPEFNGTVMEKTDV